MTDDVLDYRKDERWKQPFWLWLTLAIVFTALIAIFSEGLVYMVAMWDTKAEYSYGYLIPLIFLFLVWLRKNELESVGFDDSWGGVALVIIGLLLFLLGELSTIFTIVQYAFLMVLAGLVLAFVGLQTFKKLLAPFMIFFFMIPLPDFLLMSLSTQLQLASSVLGVMFIKLFGISVYLSGNLIDLGSMKLQVVEACSGLRYLFPLMTFGFLIAYFYRAAFYKKALIFLSTIPITVIMNSLRIGIIGVTVEYWGEAAAQGILHDFEGWIVFMACTAVLILEIWLISKLTKEKKTLKELIGIELPVSTHKDVTIRHRALSKSFVAAAVLVLISLCIVYFLPQRLEAAQPRQHFANFPKTLGDWQGSQRRLEIQYIDALKFSDYLLTDYQSQTHPSLNLYIAYYDSQKKGQSAHSPRSCIPGDGWKIEDFRTTFLGDTKLKKLVNRVLISKGDMRQLVYYWFQQRGRIITNEYAVKWYIFWDALMKNRTDGALVRITANVPSSQEIEIGETAILEFSNLISSHLQNYVPE